MKSATVLFGVSYDDWIFGKCEQRATACGTALDRATRAEQPLRSVDFPVHVDREIDLTIATGKVENQIDEQTNHGDEQPDER